MIVTTDTSVSIEGASETVITFREGSLSVKTDGEVTIHVPSQSETEE